MHPIKKLTTLVVISACGFSAAGANFNYPLTNNLSKAGKALRQKGWLAVQELKSSGHAFVRENGYVTLADSGSGPQIRETIFGADGTVRRVTRDAAPATLSELKLTDLTIEEIPGVPNGVKVTEKRGTEAASIEAVNLTRVSPDSGVAEILDTSLTNKYKDPNKERHARAYFEGSGGDQVAVRFSRSIGHEAMNFSSKISVAKDGKPIGLEIDYNYMEGVRVYTLKEDGQIYVREYEAVKGKPGTAWLEPKGPAELASAYDVAKMKFRGHKTEILDAPPASVSPDDLFQMGNGGAAR